jgi:hypothetical protein
LFLNGLSKATSFLTLEASAIKTTIHHGLAITHYKTGKQMEYKDLIRDPHYRDDWMISSANELGRLAQGVGDRVKGTNTIFFITKDKVPDGRTVTYARVVCTVCPEKDEMNQRRITAEENPRSTGTAFSPHLEQNGWEWTSLTCISTRPSTDTNTCKCTYAAFPRKASTSTTSLAL